MTTVPPRTARSNNNSAANKKHLKYTSPRCELEDAEFLPSTSLEDHDERWRHMQQQAGSHKQDGSVLDLTSRQTSPSTLKVGVPPQVASRVRELHLELYSAHSLPEWLDVVCLLFTQLQHLYTLSHYEESEDMPTADARMRRLYIIYRLPDLLSIDGKPVTLVERQLARPSSPNGYRVKREDWVVSDVEDDDDSTVSSEDDSSVLQHHGDAVEVTLMGVVKRVSADPPKEEWNEPALPKPFEVKSVTKSVERAHRIMSKSSPQKENNDVKTPTSSCGGFAAAFADGINPCVPSRRTLDEPHTLDYPTTTTDVTPPQTDQYAVTDNVRCDVRKVFARSKSKSAPLSQQQALECSSAAKENPTATSPERSSPPETKTSPQTSLSSPFPMQFRSKSFNGILPARNGGLPRKLSSPDLSPEMPFRNKGTIDSPPLIVSKVLTSPKSNRGAKQYAQRPPPCPPGLARRVAPPEHKKSRQSWRSKNAIRSTSIVDDFEEEDCFSDDEDVIEHE